MKFVVFAVLAACAFAYPLFPEFKATRDTNAGEVLVPHDLGCAFEIDVKQSVAVKEFNMTVGSATGSYYIHDTYLMVHVNADYRGAGIDVEFQELFRTDIKGSQNDTFMAYSSNKTETTNDCEGYEMTEEARKAYIEDALGDFLHNSTHQKKSTGKFGDVDCTIYTDEQPDLNMTVSYYVNADNYIIAAVAILKEPYEPPTSSSAPAPASSSAPAPASSSAPAPASSSAPAPSSTAPTSGSTSGSNSQQTRDGSASGSTSGGSGSTSGGSASSGAPVPPVPPVPTEITVEITATITYKNYAPLKKFALTKDISDKCDAAAYTAPTVALCPEPSSYVSSSSSAPASSTAPASSGAATTSVALFALLAVALIALL